MTATSDIPRRAFTFGAARHTGLIGKRDTGELLVLGAGGLLAVAMPLLLPFLALKVLGLIAPLALAVAVVFAPYRPRGSRAPRRTFYRWAEPSRTYRRTLRTQGGRWRSSAREAGVNLDGTEPEIGLPPGISRHSWLTATVRIGGQEREAAVLLHQDRRCLTAALEVEPSGLGRLDYADQVALLDVFGRSVLNTRATAPATASGCRCSPGSCAPIRRRTPATLPYAAMRRPRAGSGSLTTSCRASCRHRPSSTATGLC